MSAAPPALLDLVSRLQPGWEIHLPDDIGADLGSKPEAQLLRPYNHPKVVRDAMRCIRRHAFTGYADPAIALWEAELDRLTASGRLLRPSSCPIWRSPLADAYPANHNPLHLCFVVAHMNLHGSTFLQAHKAIGAIYRREYGRPPPSAPPLPEAELPMVEALALSLTPRQRRSIIWD